MLIRSTKPWSNGYLWLAAIAFVVLGGFVGAVVMADTAAATKPANSADEAAIRATADEFVKAFDAGDAKAIGAQWSTDAEYTDESGQEFQGRAAIEKLYAALFHDHPGAQIKVHIDSIRFLGPDIAIEKGVAEASVPKERVSTAARYTVTHARRDGKWVMVVGRDAPYARAGAEMPLNELNWMVGEWKPAVKGAAGLEIKSQWLAGHNFIRNDITFSTDSKSSTGGAQVVGWNPRLGKIVSWHFDSNGGFGQSVWTKDGHKWVLEAHGTLHDGSESSAINIIVPLDANSFTWQSVRRTLDGVHLPDVGPVKIVRVDAATK